MRPGQVRYPGHHCAKQISRGHTARTAHAAAALRRCMHDRPQTTPRELPQPCRARRVAMQLGHSHGTITAPVRVSP